MSCLLVLMFFLFGRFGHRVCNEPLACGNVAEKIGHTTGPTGLIDRNVRLADMRGGSFHVVAGGFIETMRVEVFPERILGDFQVLQ